LSTSRLVVLAVEKDNPISGNTVSENAGNRETAQSGSALGDSELAANGVLDSQSVGEVGKNCRTKSVFHVGSERSSWNVTIVTVSSELVVRSQSSSVFVFSLIFRNWEVVFVNITEFVRRMFCVTVSTFVMSK